MFKIVALVLVLFSVCSGASAASPFFPVYYGYGGYPKITTDIYYGTPQQSPPVPTVVDLGSANFWVYRDGATVNYGSSFPTQKGQCNLTPHPLYDYSKSKSATEPVEPPKELLFAYGTGATQVWADSIVQDTLHFGKNVPALAGRRVALSNYTQIAEESPGCKPIIYDRSILGLARFHNPSFPTTGPSFREDLLNDGLIDSAVMSIWFDKPPQDAKGTFHGTTLFGALPPKSKYKGDLVSVGLTPPHYDYVGYYVPVSSIGIDNGVLSKTATLSLGRAAKRCLIDTGTGNDHLPVLPSALSKAIGGLTTTKFGFPAWNGTCDSIPHDKTISLAFPGRTKGKSATVEIPLRNYARGNTDEQGLCGLSLVLQQTGECVLGAPFATAAFLAIDDAHGEVAIAQGGVSHGAVDGTGGLGEVTAVKHGERIPGAV